MNENTNATNTNTNTPASSAPVGGLQIDYQKELYEMTKKQLAWQRVSSICIFGIFAIVLIAAIKILPTLESTLKHADTVAENAIGTLDEIDKAVAEISDSNSDLNKLLNENAEPLTKAVKNMSEIDFEGMNQAIQDLQDTVGPMASFFKKFN